MDPQPADDQPFTQLWPLFLILALFLWPLDIALRRVSRRPPRTRRGALHGSRAQAVAAARSSHEPPPTPSLLAARDRKRNGQAIGHARRCPDLCTDGACDLGYDRGGARPTGPPRVGVATDRHGRHQPAAGAPRRTRTARPSRAPGRVDPRAGGRHDGSVARGQAAGSRALTDGSPSTRDILPAAGPGRRC